MSHLRLKAPEKLDFVYYHCSSRVAGGAFIFEREEKERLVNFMRLYEKLCRVKVVTYCIMSNHFHVLVEVPARPKKKPSEEEILAHLANCHGKAHAKRVEEQIRQRRAARDEKGARLIVDKMVERMWSISSFMKTFKQCFSNWYNKAHERRGTLWETRYGSTLIEGGGPALALAGAYVDLNPVRAGLVKDAKAYAWSGYGAAVAGDKPALRGIEALVAYKTAPSPKGKQALEQYRAVLSGMAEASAVSLKKKAAATVPNAHADAAGAKNKRGRPSKQKPALSTEAVLRRRVKYFRAGAAIGSAEFVNAIFDAQPHRFGRKRKDGARPMKGADFGGLCSLRALQVGVIE